jgi:hypothetical protein
MSFRVSPEVEIMCAPRRAYSELAAKPRALSVLDASYRPLIVGVTIGTSTSISSTAHVSLGLVASVTACWSFLVVIQVLAAWMVIPSAARRGMGTACALDLLFSGHAPWSLWLLATVFWALMLPISHRDSRWLLGSMMIPIVWNALIVFAFFRSALALPHDVALRRMVAHQALSVGSTLAILLSAVAIWPRIVGVFVR